MENIYSQVDEEGNMFVLMDEIIAHKKDPSAIDKSNGTYTTKNGQVCKKITTKGWKFLVQWKDETSSWVTLADLKASFPLEIADYVVANDIADKPAFAWWVPYALCKQKQILSKAKTWYWLRDSKYSC